MDDDSQHEIDQVDGSLDDVLLGLSQAFGWVPAGTLQEEVVDTAVKLAVKLAEVLSAVTLGDAVLLPLVIGVRGVSATLALTAAELLERLFAVDVLGSNESHNLGLGEIIGPLG